MKISQGFAPGDVGDIVATHARYYAKHWGFGPVFEAKVAQEISTFSTRQLASDLILVARDEAGFLASMIVDLNDPESGPKGAHLRWFICADRSRGMGLGRLMMAKAVDHAGAHANGKMWLTTFEGLGAARHLYESFGFELVSQSEGDAWGTVVQQQMFQRG